MAVPVGLGFLTGTIRCTRTNRSGMLPIRGGSTEVTHTKTRLFIAVLALLSHSGCIDVGSEVDRRKDVTTGAVSNKLPVDTRSHSVDLLSDTEATELLGDSSDADSAALPDAPLDVADLENDFLDSSEVDSCAPQCDGLECGPDMCGGLCGFCPGDDICTLGECKSCKTDCDFKDCGSDGCGGLCGTCPSKFTCISAICKAPACVSEELIYLEDFGSCSQGDFGIFDNNTDDEVTWWSLPFQFSSPPCALYLGDPQTLSYDTGSSIKLELLSPVFELPAEVALQLTFQLFMLTEILPSPLYPYDHDVLFLYYEPVGAGQTTEVWSSKSTLNSTGNQWLPMAIDLSAHAGSSGRFRFVFDTLNSIDNNNLGIYLDDFSIATICPYCKTDEECLGEDPCSVATCVHFTNFPDIGTCITKPIEECCLLDPENFCNDGDPCTLELCDPNSATCFYEQIPNCPP
jgi:hypothetical protein